MRIAQAQIDDVEAAYLATSAQTTSQPGMPPRRGLTKAPAPKASREPERS
jgi:hypothetical protein